jgi:acyl-CoA thioester hydrolase
MGVAERSFTTRWRVRVYELDANGHVNNSVYLAYAEEVAALHAESFGFGRAWAMQRGGMWVVRKHAVTYYRPAVYGDELELTTRVDEMRGARGVRQTAIKVVDGPLLADVTTEWVWVRAADGRPTRVPADVIEVFART